MNGAHRVGGLQFQDILTHATAGTERADTCRVKQGHAGQTLHAPLTGGLWRSRSRSQQQGAGLGMGASSCCSGGVGLQGNGEGAGADGEEVCRTARVYLMPQTCTLHCAGSGGFYVMYILWHRHSELPRRTKKGGWETTPDSDECGADGVTPGPLAVLGEGSAEQLRRTTVPQKLT